MTRYSCAPNTDRRAGKKESLSSPHYDIPGTFPSVVPGTFPSVVPGTSLLCVAEQIEVETRIYSSMTDVIYHTQLLFFYRIQFG